MLESDVALASLLHPQLMLK